MKKLEWIKEGDPIPDAATYLKANRKIVTKWEPQDHFPEYASEWHTEYLYEVPTTSDDSGSPEDK